MLLTIDGGPRFCGPHAGAGNESPERKPCAVFENRKGQMASKKRAVEQIVGKFREAKVEPGTGLTAGQRCVASWA